MTRTLIAAGGLASPAGITGPATLSVEDGRIRAIESGVLDILPAGSIDARDLILSPGLMDIHTHGAGGSQVIDGTAEALAAMSVHAAAGGVTSFLATVSGGPDSIAAGIRAVVDASRSPLPGARCLGIHLEGPFINPAYPGAFEPASIRPPDLGIFDDLAGSAAGLLRRMTLAPELDGADALISRASALGVRCSAGHSGLAQPAFDRAIEAGVSSVTHLFNAMPPIDHHAPSIATLALTDDRITVELIADGLHVDPAVLRLVARAKGWRGIALITDSIAAAGMPDGRYHYEEQDIVVGGGAARLDDGRLAGSIIDLASAVRMLTDASDLRWEEALGSATLVPARLQGLDSEIGELAIGHRADIAAFDQDRRVAWTMVGGTVVHAR